METLKRDLNLKNAFASEIICNKQQYIHGPEWKVQVKNKCIHNFFFFFLLIWKSCVYKLLPQREMEQTVRALKNFSASIATRKLPCMITCYAIKMTQQAQSFNNISIKSEKKQVILPFTELRSTWSLLNLYISCYSLRNCYVEVMRCNRKLTYLYTRENVLIYLNSQVLIYAVMNRWIK